MAVFYQPETIDNLMQTVSYEDVLRFYDFPIRGNGKNRGSNCPNCGKNHHHFKINTHRNTAHCFSCRWAGNPIQFIQKVDSIGFIKAVEVYAEIGQVELPSSDKPMSIKEKILHHTMEYYKQFESDYLLKRGIDPKVIQENDVGYSPGGTKLKEHLNGLYFSDAQLLDAGVIVERSGKLRDFFYQCVVIPIRSGRRIVDLYGRHVGSSSNVRHVYLYGDHIAYNLDRIDSKLPVIIVESMIDAFTLFSHGITNVIATGGTHFSKRHARQLQARKVQKVYIAYDTGDQSKTGQRAAIQAGKLLHDMNIEAHIIQMPENTDMNEFFVKYDDAFDRLRELITYADPVKEYEIKFLLDDMSTEWIEIYLKNRKESVLKTNEKDDDHEKKT